LPALTEASTDSVVQWALDKVPNATTYLSLDTRKSDDGRDAYRGKARIGSNGAVTLDLIKVSGGVETSMKSTTLTGVTVGAGDRLWVRLQADGTSPTTLRLKAWVAGTPQPTNWTLTATDSTSGLQSAGKPGLVTYLSSSTTNGPVRVDVDNFLVVPLL
jgi:hypothetical protein